jgi:hypothetical protein
MSIAGVLVALMGVFFAAMSACALAFWAAAVVVPGGIGGVIGLVGFGVMTIFGTLHILAADHRRPPCGNGNGGVCPRCSVSRWRRRRCISASRCWLRSSSTYLATTVLDRIL